MSVRHIGLTLLSLGVVSASVAGIYVSKNQGLKYYFIENTAMEPTLTPGDLSIGRKIEANQLRVGDVVVFNDSTTTATKRVRSISTSGVITVVADNQDRSVETVQPSALQARYIKSIPLLGYVLKEIRHPIVLVGLVYIPIGLIIVREARYLARATWRKPYRIG